VSVRRLRDVVDAMTEERSQFAFTFSAAD